MYSAFSDRSPCAAASETARVTAGRLTRHSSSSSRLSRAAPSGVMYLALGGRGARYRPITPRSLAVRYSIATFLDITKHDERVSRHPCRDHWYEVPDRAGVRRHQERREGASGSPAGAARAEALVVEGAVAERRALRAPARDRARAPPRDGLRGIDLPQHRRVLEQRHGDDHVDGQGLHACVPVLRGRHGEPPRLARFRGAREL